MVKCEFCDTDLKNMMELEDHLRIVHEFSIEDVEQYGFDRGLYYEAEIKKEVAQDTIPCSKCGGVMFKTIYGWYKCRNEFCFHTTKNLQNSDKKEVQS